jgi:NAD(P)-dependent dehydrogenase (short-subunit alcohol dehydrogenase family)
LWLAGTEIDWGSYYGEEKRRRIALPTYPFERQSFWIEPGRNTELVLRHEERSANKKRDIADWFYEPVWSEAPLPKIPEGEMAAEKAGHWLVFVDGCGLGIQVVAALKRVTNQLTTVEAGSGFGQTGSDEYVINPAEADDYRRLMHELRQSGVKVAHIVHLWNVTRDSKAQLDELQAKGFYSLLWLAKALGLDRSNNAIQLDIVADHLYAVESNEEFCPVKATLLGPCRVIPQEYPHVSTRIIDMTLATGQETEQQVVENLLQEITATGCSDVTVSYRLARRLVQSFSRRILQQIPPEKEVLRQGGVYLITGGMGGVGLALAEKLAGGFGAHVVITGRKTLPPESEWGAWLSTHEEFDTVSARIRKLQALKEKGADVMAVTADVSDEVRMRELVEDIQKRFGRLDGVLHAAGITEEQSQRLIQDVTKDDCEQHFQPKVQGTLVLERVLEGKGVDFCLLFSSLSATLGGPLLSAYGGANAFLDSFAVQKGKSNRGTRWLAVNWDTWKGEEEEALNLRYKGLSAKVAESIAKCRSGSIYSDVMTTGEGWEAVRRVLGWMGSGHIVASTAELQIRLDHLIYRKALREKKVTRARKSTQGTSYYARPHCRRTTSRPTTRPKTGWLEFFRTCWESRKLD